MIRDFFSYSLTELIGCLLATGLFQFVRLANMKKRTVGREGPRQESIASKCAAEFTGTFYLTLTVGLVCSAPAAPALGVFGIASSLQSSSTSSTTEPRLPFAWESMPRHTVGYGRALATFRLGFSPVRELVLVMRGIRNPARGGQAARSDILW